MSFCGVRLQGLQSFGFLYLETRYTLGQATVAGAVRDHHDPPIRRIRVAQQRVPAARRRGARLEPLARVALRAVDARARDAHGARVRAAAEVEVALAWGGRSARAAPGRDAAADSRPRSSPWWRPCRRSACT